MKTAYVVVQGVQVSHPDTAVACNATAAVRGDRRSHRLEAELDSACATLTSGRGVRAPVPDVDVLRGARIRGNQVVALEVKDDEATVAEMVGAKEFPPAAS